MNEHELTAKTIKGYEMFGRRDIPGLLETYADDIEWELPKMEGVPYAGAWRGKEQLVKFFQTFDSAIQTTRFDVKDMVAQGNKVVVMGIFEGMAKPTGRSFENEWVNIHTYDENGQLVRFQQFSNTTVPAAAFKSS